MNLQRTNIADYLGFLAALIRGSAIYAAGWVTSSAPPSDNNSISPAFGWKFYTSSGAKKATEDVFMPYKCDVWEYRASGSALMIIGS